MCHARGVTEKKRSSEDFAKRLTDEFGNWFDTNVIQNNIKNLEELRSSKSLNINPYLAPYVTFATTGSMTETSLASSLIVARTFVTSLNTSFGMQLQKALPKFFSTVFGSPTTGVDVEFDDFVDGKHKFAQIKAGPATINQPDVEPIHESFQKIKRKARLDGLELNDSNFVIGVFYGTESDLSANYRKLRDRYGYSVYAGNELWKRLTGIDDLQSRLVEACGQVAQRYDLQAVIADVASDLADDPLIQDIVSAYR